MKYINFSLLFLLYSINVLGYQTEFYSMADRFLKSNVKNGVVSYEDIRLNPGELKALQRQISTMNLNKLTATEEKAFYVNAYNILTIISIINNYPIKSVMNIEGFFNGIKHNVGGEDMTLDYIEKDILMKKYFDPNLHFVLVCGAKSCPPLASFAYLPNSVNEQIKERAALVLNHPDFLKYEGGNYLFSKIFEWYKSDFTKDLSTIISYINQYRNKKIPANSKLIYYEYDWDLNN